MKSDSCYNVLWLCSAQTLWRSRPGTCTSATTSKKILLGGGGVVRLTAKPRYLLLLHRGNEKSNTVTALVARSYKVMACASCCFTNLGRENPTSMEWWSCITLKRLFVCDFKCTERERERERERESTGYKVMCPVTYTDIVHVLELFRQVELAGDFHRARVGNVLYAFKANTHTHYTHTDSSLNLKGRLFSLGHEISCMQSYKKVYLVVEMHR